MNDERAVALLLELIRVPGESGRESAVRSLIARRLAESGVPESAMRDDGANHRSPRGGECGNLVVHLGGDLPGPHRVLMAHMDTVPLCVGAEPLLDLDLGVVRSASPSHALGGDDRAGCAAVVTAARELLEAKTPHPPLTLLFTVQEETGLFGARHLDLDFVNGAEFAVNFDGGRPGRCARGATGAYRIVTTIEGKAAHAGVHPELGVSAIAAAARGIARVESLGLHGLIDRNGVRATSNIGIIRGGDATNVVTAACALESEVRCQDATVRKEIMEAFCAAFTPDPGADFPKVRHEVELTFESFEMADDDPLVRWVCSVMTRTGLAPETAVANGGLDANWISSRGIPCVTVGVGQQNIHAIGEELNVPEFLAACRLGIAFGSENP